MKKKTKKRIGLAASAVVIVIAGINIYRAQGQYAVADGEYDKISEAVYLSDEPVNVVKAEEVTEEEEEESPYFGDGTYPNLVVDHDALKKVNENYEGWLYMPCLDISYPVVQGEDNEYYLHHTFEDTENISGCIFTDYQNKPGVDNYNTIFYGHNMKNGSMFGSLRKMLTDSKIITEDPYIYYYDKDGVRVYQVYSYHRTKPQSNDFEMQTNERQYWQYIDRALSDRLTDMNIGVDKSRNSIMLSTCNGSGESKQRLVIHAINIGFYR